MAMCQKPSFLLLLGQGKDMGGIDISIWCGNSSKAKHTFYLQNSATAIHWTGLAFLVLILAMKFFPLG